MNDDLWCEIAIDTKLELPIPMFKRKAELLEKKTGVVLDAQRHSMKMTGKDTVCDAFNNVELVLSYYMHKVDTICQP